jgi:regulator of cell morphogenesis and NO signaling
MTSNCGCCAATAANERSANRPIHADHRVGDIAGQYAGALEIMRQLGINHCCGAGLTLAEAAAAAGVPVERLLEALNARVEVGT